MATCTDIGRSVKVKSSVGPFPAVLCILALCLLAAVLDSPARAYDPSAGDLSKEAAADVRLLTYNTWRRFIADPDRDVAFNRILTALAPDIILFQEVYYTVSAAAVRTRLDSVLPYGSPWQTHEGVWSWQSSGGWILDLRTVLASRWPIWGALTDTDPAASVRGVTIGGIDLPDGTYAKDLYLLGVHLKSYQFYDDGIPERQRSADAIAAWMGDARDAKEAGRNNVSLEPGTPMVALGDFNFVTGPQADITVRTGDIQNRAVFGPDVKGDWDNTDLTDASPVNPWNAQSGTWPSDSTQPFGRLDRFYYTDHVLMVANSFVLNTKTMDESQLAAAGLQYYDTDKDSSSDHLPVVMDVRIVVRETPTPPTYRTPSPTPSPVELLVNGGFESWSGSNPSSWSSDAGVSLARETGVTHGGASSAALTATGGAEYNGVGMYQQYSSPVAGRRYTFSAWVWSAHTGDMGISANWWVDDSEWWPSTPALSTRAGEWERLSISDTAPPGVYNVRVRVRGFAGYALCGYADDATLFESLPSPPPTPTPAPTATPASNLLTNGGFESWHTVREPMGWTVVDGATAEQEPFTIRAGSYGAALGTTTDAGSWGLGVWQDVKVTVGWEYVLSAWVWSAFARSVNITFSWWNGSSSVYEDTAWSTTAGSWEELSVSGTAPAGAITARVYVRGKANSAFCGYADEVRFRGCLATPSPAPSPTPLSDPRLRDRTDYDGDGTSDIAIFRPDSGLWAIRGHSRAYFGGFEDLPVPGDYDGDGTTDMGIFRPASGLWAARGVTRTYFGESSDDPIPGDYEGSGTTGVAIFRPSSGLWAIKGVTRAYFGGSSDLPVPGYWAGDPGKSIGIFRPVSGLWAIRGITRTYFGSSADDPVPGDYAGAGSWTPAIFRESSGLWAARGVTRAYFGGTSDYPVPGGYQGDGKDYPGIFRWTSGLWAVWGVTRAYFGASSDIPVTR